MFISLPPSFQTLLRNNVTARFFHAQLAATDWTVTDVTNFLSKRPSKQLNGALTWREVFNETDQAIMSISRFMEVSVFLIVSQSVCFLLETQAWMSGDHMT